MLSGGAPTPIPSFPSTCRASQWREEGYYGWDYKNFAPRLAFAYSPGQRWLVKSLFGEGDKTVVAAAFGMVFDRIGSGLLSTFDRRGSFGLSTGITAQFRRRPRYRASRV